jgi:predicted AlkP superfamily pyrophosphatase or phosphodiesterase
MLKYFLLGIFLLCSKLFFAQKVEIKTEHVIVLVIDGVRHTETFGDTTYQNVPNLFYKLAPQGVLNTNFRANTPQTTTNAGHTAMVTGRYQRIKNNGTQLPRFPSMFQYYMKQHDIHKDKLWVISSKGKLSILGNTKHRKWHDLYQPHVFCGRNGNGKDHVGDAKTWEKVLQVVDNYAPKLMIINLLAPDARAHANLWDGYIEAIKQSDEYALELWDKIQKHPEMKDKTTLLITSDHGRNADGFRDGFISHGARTESNKRIFMLALGPDSKKGVMMENDQHELIDIAATASFLLGFDMPTARGKVMRELFKNGLIQKQNKD